MKILEINTRYHYGGSPPRIAYELTYYLREQGHDVYAVYGYDNQEVNHYDSKVYRMGSRMIRHVSNFQTRLVDGGGFHNVLETKKMLKWVEKVNPDIIHLHNLHGYYVNVELLLTWIREQNIPVVVTMHDCWLMTGHCTHFDHIGCEKWKTCCDSCPALREYPATIFLDRTREQFLKKKLLLSSLPKVTYIAPSEWLADIAHESFLRDRDIRVINNGIDTEVFHPTTGNIKSKYHLQGKKIVLSVANIYGQRKGTELLYKLPSMLPEDFVLVLIGRIPKSDETLLPANCLSISRTENTMELAEWYTAADVFVNPTLEDNFPTVNLEALACGTPVVTYRTGGSPESIDNQTGRVIEKGDEKSFVEAILELSFLDTSSACRERAIRLYNKNENYKKYEQIMCEIVK